MQQDTRTDIPHTGWTPPGWAPPAAQGPSWPPPPPPAPKRKTGRYLLFAVATFIIGAAIAGAADTDTSTTTANGVVSTPSTLATGSTGSSGSGSMANWATRYGAPDADVLTDDLTAMASDANSLDISGLGSSCRTFQRHLSTAKSHLPAPDAEVTSALRLAYNFFDLAADHCISGTATFDPDDIEQSTAYLGLGTASLRDATAALNKY